jgi:diguanylate cyclase (GGDEF)-like protein
MVPSEANLLISEISKEALELLERTATPALPPYYAKAFMEVAASKESEAVAEVMARLGRIDATMRQEKSLEESVGLARSTIHEYATSTNRLKNIASDQGAILDLKDLEQDSIVPLAVVEELRQNYTSLSNEIKKAEMTILKLEDDLDKVEMDTFVDPLTRLRMPVLLDRQLEQILEAGRERDLDCFLVLVGVDNFETFKEEYGYVVMEKVLLFMAKSLQNTIRSENRIYRYGEPTFAVVFNRMDRDAVHAALERVRHRVEVSKLVYSEKVINITITAAGVGHKAGDTPAMLRKKAEEALGGILGGNSVSVTGA